MLQIDQTVFWVDVSFSRFVLSVHRLSYWFTDNFVVFSSSLI